MKISLETIASIHNLRIGWKKIFRKKAKGGIDGQTVQSFQENAESNLDKLSIELLSQKYVPEPFAYSMIRKSGKAGFRELGRPSVRDKIIQSVIADQLVQLYNAKFSNCSYAYRIGKGTVKAIGRVRDFLMKKNYWVSAIDIDDFFDNIDHDKCIEILKRDIQDLRVLRLIRLYLSTGVIKHNRWEDKTEGVSQGGVLSPILSNIYLNEFDQFLHSINTDFVRFSDDFVMFGKKRESLIKSFKKAELYLNEELSLKLNYTDTPVINVAQGFSFLGIFFHKNRIRIDSKRFDEKVKKIKKIAKSKNSPQEIIYKLNERFSGIERYYARLAIDNRQLSALESTAINCLSKYIAEKKQNGSTMTRKEWHLILSDLRFFQKNSRKQKEQLIKKIIDGGFEIYRSKNSKRSVNNAIGRKRRKYAKKISLETELVVSKFGHYIGLNKNQFTIKHKGRIVASVPKKKLRRIVISSKGVSISSNLIQECSDLKISIEFISFRGEPYALLYTPESGMARSYDLQLKTRNTPDGHYLCQCFIKGKAKNQINLLKYFNKYLRRKKEKISYKITKTVKKMEGLLAKINNQNMADKENKDFKMQLMGFEGNISSLYWNSLSLILPDDIDFKTRIKRGAVDLFNSSINYGYGILYNRIQKSLVDAGAALTISFLHEPSGRKPTLVFDMIEEFRQYIVDRPIIAMFNKKEPIRTNSKGLLTAKTRQLVIENIQERLGSYVTWRKKRWKCEEIIQHQSRLLMHHLNGHKKYMPFIGRY